MALAIRYFAFEGRASPVVAVLEGLEDRFRAAILSDIERVGEYQLKAPVSVRSIKGHSRNEMWILHCCKKQDQRHGIEVASECMKLVQER